MSFPSKRLILPAITGALSLLCALSAHASAVTDIAIPYSTTGLDSGSWANSPYGGSSIPNAPQNGNTGTGITFGDWNGHFNEVTPGQTTVFSIGVALGTSTTVNTLLNTFYGDTNLDAIVTFTNSLNQTVVFDLIGGDTIRDFNQNSYQNGLTGGTAGVLTAQNWWNNGSSGQRLDVQTFFLPTSWNGTTLTSMTIANPTTPPDNPSPDDDLSALQVVTTASTTPPSAVTPEPSSLALLLTGVSGVVGILRRRRSNA